MAQDDTTRTEENGETERHREKSRRPVLETPPPVISLLAMGLVSTSRAVLAGSTGAGLSDVTGSERSLGRDCFPDLAELVFQRAVVEVPKRFLALCLTPR